MFISMNKTQKTTLAIIMAVILPANLLGSQVSYSRANVVGEVKNSEEIAVSSIEAIPEAISTVSESVIAPLITETKTETKSESTGGSHNSESNSNFGSITTPCVGDLNQDGQVDSLDTAILTSFWNIQNSGSELSSADINQDGTVDGADLGLLLGNWGVCSSGTVSGDFATANNGGNTFPVTDKSNTQAPNITDIELPKLSTDESVIISGGSVTLPNTNSTNHKNTADSDGDTDTNTDQNSGGNGGGGGGHHSSGSSAQSTTTVGEVLGASTCSNPSEWTIKEYLKYGANNNPEEVKKLQAFLNTYQGSKLSITGVYESETLKAVKDFQLLHSMFILKPWADAGLLNNEKDATGYVYKTTKRWINMIACPSAGIPMPQLF